MIFLGVIHKNVVRISNGQEVYGSTVNSSIGCLGAKYYGIARKFEQKLCGFPEDKNSNKKKFWFADFKKELLKMIFKKS